MQRKVQQRYVDHGFGFPVVLRKVPMVKVFGVWAPDINYRQLERGVLLALAHKATRLTGNEVRFIRQAFKLTLQEFGERFDVRHTAVLKWEKAADLATRMDWSTEKDIRLFILDQLLTTEDLEREIVPLYRNLSSKKTGEPVPLERSYAELVACW